MLDTHNSGYSILEHDFPGLSCSQDWLVLYVSILYLTNIFRHIYIRPVEK